MTALTDLCIRYPVAAGMLGLSLLGSVAIGFNAQQSHKVTEVTASEQLLSSAENRASRQFEDFRKIMKVVEDVAPLQINGAEKARQLAKAERQIAEHQPDGGAAQYDDMLFSAVGDLPGSDDYTALLQTVNYQKNGLRRAAYDLTNIKFALITDDREGLIAAFADLDAVLATHPSTEAVSAVEGRFSGKPVDVTVSEAHQTLTAALERQDVTIDPKRIDVVIPR